MRARGSVTAADLVAPMFVSCVRYECRNVPRNLSAPRFHAEVRAAAEISNSVERLVRLDTLAKESIGMCPACAVRS